MDRRVLAFFVGQVVAVALALSSAANPTAAQGTVIVESAKPEQVDQMTLDLQYIQSLITQHDEELNMLAKLVYREARGVGSKTQQAAVIWCVFNRVDSQEYTDNIGEVISQRYQFAYRARTPLKEEFKALAVDVFTRWQLEKLGYPDVGRVLPKEYLFFDGQGGVNRFRTEYQHGVRWKWTLETPYES